MKHKTFLHKTAGLTLVGLTLGIETNNDFLVTSPQTISPLSISVSIQKIGHEDGDSHSRFESEHSQVCSQISGTESMCQPHWLNIYRSDMQ